ncbi:MAG: sugar phosphate nucleotidyltransferase [candidate division Zixibacteria bacterium]|nr:sugar phosphate nucleotidyltransferase [candidate division Zixibacteria bacterium]
MFYGIILAGGRGERFWPLSRADRPKQFLKLTSDKTMLEETIERVLPLIPLERIRIVTAQSMSAFITDSIPYISDDFILGEPQGKNTCAAIGLAAVHLLKSDPKAVMVVLSADHLIRPPERLLEIIKSGVAIASNSDCLITIGIVPTRAETGYGYIKLGEPFKHEGDGPVYHVAAFTEKPRAVVAHEYYYSGKYLWNAGMFIWSAESILAAIRNCQPELAGLLEEYSGNIGTAREAEARRHLYTQAVPISIDFAVLEKAQNVLTIKADIMWDDVGGWNALSRYRQTDSDNNVIIGDAVTLDTYETTIYNKDEGLVACLGISDMVVVRSDNITLVAHKTKTAGIKEILARLEEDEKTRKYL